MDPKRWCKYKEDHRLYHAIGQDCPCIEEMVKARKAKVAALRNQINNPNYGYFGVSISPGVTGVIQNVPVQRSKISYVPDPRRRSID